MSNANYILVLDMLKQLDSDLSYEQICRMTQEQKEAYRKLYQEFIDINSKNEKDKDTPKNIKKLKGDALENLVTYLLEVSGNLFHVTRNIRTNTNEIDQFVELNPNGLALCGLNILDERYKLFLGECKNYNGKVSVTYVGKFCNLMLQSQIKLGIIFSYHGVSGKTWNNGSGVIRKFYLHKERVDERYCVIDFSKNEFERILNGDNFLQIIKEQMTALQLDTNYSSYLKTHPAEKYL